jgi:hypothetical protein
MGSPTKPSAFLTKQLYKQLMRSEVCGSELYVATLLFWPTRREMSAERCGTQSRPFHMPMTSVSLFTTSPSSYYEAGRLIVRHGTQIRHINWCWNKALRPTATWWLHYASSGRNLADSP